MVKISQNVTGCVVKPVEKVSDVRQQPILSDKPDVFEKTTINFSDKLKEKFSEKEIEKLSKKSVETQEKANILANTKLSAEDITFNLYYRNKDLDAEKVAEKILQLEDECGENLQKIKLNSNEYDCNALNIEVELKDGNKKINTIDKNGNLRSKTQITYETRQNNKFEIKKSRDVISGMKSKVVSKIVNEKRIPQSELIITKNYKEIAEQSDIKGIFNRKRFYSDGRIDEISSGKIDEKTGIKTVKKNMTSLDGTKTEYLFEDDPKGNRIVDYKIVDKSGNLLYKNSEAFEVIDENTFISSKNDKSYMIKYSEDNKKLNILDRKTKENTEIDLHSYILGLKSKKLIPVLKTVSGDELIKMKENVTRLFQIDDDTASFYHPARKDVTTCDTPYIFLHELGHAKDMQKYDATTFKTKDATAKLLISADEDVNKVYEEEKALFNEYFSNNQQEHIGYFINNGGLNVALKESVAETNALLNTYNTVDRYAMRADYLQRYFPRTISKLATKLID